MRKVTSKARAAADAWEEDDDGVGSHTMGSLNPRVKGTEQGKTGPALPRTEQMPRVRAPLGDFSGSLLITVPLSTASHQQHPDVSFGKTPLPAAHTHCSQLRVFGWEQLHPSFKGWNLIGTNPSTFLSFLSTEIGTERVMVPDQTPDMKK